MNKTPFHGPRALSWGILWFTAMLSVGGCKKPAPKVFPESARQKRLEWNLKTLVDAYQTAGHTSLKWDEQAKAALTEFARARSRSTDPDEDWASIISRNSSAATEAGCDDPMIHYLNVRYGPDQSAGKEKFADAYCETATEMENSSYPPVRKFYCWLRAGLQVESAYGYGTNIPAPVRQLLIWMHAETNLVAALADPTLPPEEVYEASHELLETWKGGTNHYDSLYQTIERQLRGDRANTSEALLLKGEVFIEMAWQARGGGYADSVSKGSWNQFKDRLKVAEQALTEAWQANPTDPRIAVKMIGVELGQGGGRDRMELWFQRAMELDPNDYEACNSKLHYIEPIWYGSADDMLAFGRECVHHEQWGGHVPLILMDAHIFLQQNTADGPEKVNYWKRPEVWADLKSAFDRFFQLNPSETSWNHNYAWYAWQAGQWGTLNALLPKLGPVNYDYFGGKEEFDKMAAQAKEHAGDSAPADH